MKTAEGSIWYKWRPKRNT